MSKRSKQKHDRRTLRQKISLRKILRFLFSRMVVVGVLIFLQLAFLVALLVTLEGHLVYAYPVLLVLSVGVSVWVVTGEANPAYKLSWVLLISAVPVFGGLFYLMFGNQRTPDDLKARIQQFYDATIQRSTPISAAGRISPRWTGILPPKRPILKMYPASRYGTAPRVSISPLVRRSLSR